MEQIKDVVAGLKRMARNCVYKQFAQADRKKINSKDFEKMMLQASVKGALDVAEYLIKVLEEKEMTVDLLKGDLHLLRIELWEGYRTTNHLARKIELDEAMKVELNNLILRM